MANDHLGYKKGAPLPFIGVLDIFGFESFKVVTDKRLTTPTDTNHDTVLFLGVYRFFAFNLNETDFIMCFCLLRLDAGGDDDDSFQVNGLEQILINFANEYLQNVFNKQVREV